MADLYKTKKAENAEFNEEQLLELSYQILQALKSINFKGGLHFKSMLRMDNIMFDTEGRIKLQEMSHVIFD